ncbi:hypothetical protein [Priestia endophytica]|uniref:hypothetical protein n=1 Tax=Priestia endophytica TaxID=135735 RepID=UPI000DCA6BBE|nr:hypothetical protein [Priestia endophytica]RAS80276.1 hypothetical protein A4U60_16540 [Priestia endophytica]
MIGLMIAIILFNTIAFTMNRRLTINQIVHIWTFTIALQVLVDLYIDGKYHSYWYFNENTEWRDLFTLTILIPPVNMMFLNGYLCGRSFPKRMMYIFYWVIAIRLYEAITLLPEPWGYFHHGWWNLWYSLLVNPFLLGMVLFYYKWIRKMEK